MDYYLQLMFQEFRCNGQAVGPRWVQTSLSPGVRAHGIDSIASCVFVFFRFEVPSIARTAKRISIPLCRSGRP